VRQIGLIIVVLSVLVAWPVEAGNPESQVETIEHKDENANSVMARRVISHQGLEREYLVYTPPGDPGSKGFPVVFALHGYTSTASGFEAYHGLNRHAKDNRYQVVYPQGSYFKASSDNAATYMVTSWNDLAANRASADTGLHCLAGHAVYPCPPECDDCGECGWTSCYDDLGFLRKVLDEVAADAAVDTSRFYLLGVSNGGMMALTLACEFADRFAAVAPIIAQLAPGFACAPDVDLPMMHLFSGKDRTVPFDGLPGSDGYVYTSASETAAVWAESMHCQAAPQLWESAESQQAGLRCTAYSACTREGDEIVSCLNPDGGHNWPQQRVEGTQATCVTEEQYESMSLHPRCKPGAGEYKSDGMSLVWRFFRRFSR